MASVLCIHIPTPAAPGKGAEPPVAVGQDDELPKGEKEEEDAEKR